MSFAVSAAGFVEVGLVERGDLALVGEQDVDVGADQLEELGAVAVDAEPVGKGQRNWRPALPGDGGGLAESGLGLGPVEQVALEIDDGRLGDQICSHFALVELGVMPRKVFMVRSPSGVTRISERDVGALPVDGLGVEGDAGGRDVVAENAAELVARRPCR